MTDDEIDVPEGWTLSSLGEVVFPVRYKVNPATMPEARYIGLEHVEAQSMRLLRSGRAGDVRSTKTRFSAGDVLYGKLRPYLNKVIRPDFDGICSTDFLVFAESLELDPGFFACYLNQAWVADRAHQMSAGIERPRIEWRTLSQFPIAYPPSKEEQRAIVQQVERLRGLGNDTTSHVMIARRALNRLRQAIPAAAASGRLTADWREDQRESVRVEALVDRLDSLHGARLSTDLGALDFDSPKPWGRVSLDRLTSLVTSGSRGWAKYYASEGSVFIRAQNINSDQLDLSDAVFVRPPPGSEGVRTRVSKGDLLVTITGANVTRSAWVDRDIGEAYVNQHVALARPLIPEMSQYLHLWIISPAHGRKELAADAYGAGKPGLNLDNLRTMPVALPSLEEQAEIVRRVNALNELADRVDERAAAAALDAGRSSEAVLAKAFRGDLLTVGPAGADADS